MAPMGEHETAEKRRDHLWVAVIIAACCLLEVWASWIAIGSMSGFPMIGGKHGLPTDWTLAVTMEAYWAYALYAWLAGAAGPRSRAFAKWSAVSVFVLSLTGQGAAHLVKPGTPPPAFLVVFVTALPVLVLALIAVLIHLRQEDRKEAAAAARKVRKADEVTDLRAALSAAREAHEAGMRALREELDGERTARETAEREAERTPAIEAARDAFRTELEAARAAAQAAEDARTSAARETAAAAEDAAVREARCRELEVACGSLQAELRTVRETRENEVRSLQSSLDAERRAHGDAERGAVLLPVIQAQLEDARAAAEAARGALEAAEAARTEAEQRAARAEAKAASLTRTPAPRAGSKSTPAAPPAGRTQLDIVRDARELADKILAGKPDISGAELAERCGMKERWGQTYKKQFLERGHRQDGTLAGQAPPADDDEQFEADAGEGNA